MDAPVRKDCVRVIVLNSISKRLAKLLSSCMSRCSTNLAFHITQRRRPQTLPIIILADDKGRIAETRLHGRPVLGFVDDQVDHFGWQARSQPLQELAHLLDVIHAGVEGSVVVGTGEETTQRRGGDGAADDLWQPSPEEAMHVVGK